jgi:hypothetical protein
LLTKAAFESQRRKANKRAFQAHPRPMPRVTMDALRRQTMGIWLELGIFGIVLAFAFWQMHDVRKAQEETRRQREREKERPEDRAGPP